MDRTLRLHFLKAGMYTTVQDTGRFGYQQYGVPVGGAMDLHAAQQANRLVGNPEGAPLLEITMIGPTIKFLGTGYIALTGANLSATINTNSIPMHKPVPVRNESVLSFGRPEHGCRAYLAVAGKWEVSSWLGSSGPSISQPDILTPGSILKKHSEVVIDSVSTVDTKEPQAYRAKKESAIRILRGPEFHTFHREFVHKFFSTRFIIRPESNRIGYRLDPGLDFMSDAREIISSGMIPGTIQITGSGQPIILMRDAQTTGGYPRFANVLSEDIDKLAQMKPGDSFSFELI